MILARGAPFGIALLGLMLGMRHATDPDHVIAVTTILSRERRLSTATRIGLVWGLGHTATVLAVGSMIIVFKVAISARAGLAMEFAVAVALIILGIPSVALLVRRLAVRFAPAGNSEREGFLVHSHAHSHHGTLHRHSHVHSADSAQSIDTASDHDHLLPRGLLSAIAVGRPMLKAFAVGLVHGLAGSAAIALLVLGAIPQPLWATLYLALFCLGTVLGMGFITTVIGAPFALSNARMVRLHHGLVLASGFVSFGFGLLIAWQVGVTDHLFGALPRWTPQ